KAEKKAHRQVSAAGKRLTKAERKLQAKAEKKAGSRRHPVRTVLVVGAAGAGAAWLIRRLLQAGQQQSPVPPRVAEAATAAKDKVAAVAETVKDKAEDVVEAAKDKAGDLADAAKDA